MSYRPVTTLIKAVTPEDGLVVGEGGLLFGLYPDRQLRDDSALGLISGAVPDAIVIESCSTNSCTDLPGQNRTWAST